MFTDSLIRVGKNLGRKAFPRLRYTRNVRQWAKAEQEIALLPALCQRSAVSIDVGANRGCYIWHLLQTSARVVAFEPLPSMHELLRSMYGSKIELHRVVLSDRVGTTQLRVPVGDCERATIAETNQLLGTSSDVQRIAVPMCTLDSLQLTNVAFIKIDVEGHEEAVVRGSIQTLKRFEPNLLIEIEERHCPGSLDRVNALLSDLEYSGAYIDGDAVLPLTGFDASRDQSPSNLHRSGTRTGKYINNFIFVPRSKLQAITAQCEAILISRMHH